MSGELARASFAGGLRRDAPETLSEAYDRLQEARLARAAFDARLADERRRLDEKASYLLGSLEAARGFLGEAGEGASLEALSTQARGELESARAELEAWAEVEQALLEDARTRAEAGVLERIEAWQAHRRPELRVRVARLAGHRRVVHVDRPEADDALLLCALLAGRPPSRPDFLEDDAVDEVDGPVHLAAGEAGIDPAAVHAAGADAEDALARGEARLLPIRAHVPVRLPGDPWPRLRLRTRGPVLELESREAGAAYDHLVPSAHAESFTGWLVSLQVRGLLQVDVDVE